jgi:hypothetical protein
MTGRGPEDMTVINSTRNADGNEKIFKEIRAWAEANEFGMFFLASGQVPLSPKQWTGGTPTKEDIRLHTCLSLDLDDNKRHPQFQGNPEKVKTALKRVLTKLGFYGYWLIESSPENFNVMIPMRPSDNSSGRNVEQQKQKIMRLLTGRGNRKGLLAPLGADPGASGIRREIRLPNVKRNGHTIEAEWFKAAGEDAPYHDGRRSSFWCAEEWLKKHAAKKYAARVDVIPRGWNPNCPHGGISKDRVAWSLLKYILLLPDDLYRGSGSDLAEWISHELEENITARHVSRGLETLQDDDVLIHETSQGRGGGTTLKVIKEHKPPRKQVGKKSSGKDRPAKQIKPPTLLGSWASSSCGSTGVDGEGLVSSYSFYKETSIKGGKETVGGGENVGSRTNVGSAEQERPPIENKTKKKGLQKEPEVGKRHRAIVGTAVYLANNGGSRETLEKWIRKKVIQPSGSRPITEQEIRRAWTWAKRNRSKKTKKVA